MNKLFYFVISLLLICVLGTGCAKAGLSFGAMEIKFDTIKVTDQVAGNAVTLDGEKTKELYNKLKSINYVKEAAAKEKPSPIYTIAFMDGNREADKFNVINENTIEYKDNIYKTDSSGIDINYLKQISLTNFQALVLDTNSGLLVMPDKNSNEFKSSDKISVNTAGALIYDKDGQKTELESIQAGDMVEIAYNGVIMESYPAQISAYSIKVLEDMLVEGYLSIIDDIYKDDPGLNGDIEILALDTSELKNLSSMEKEKLLNDLKEKYGLEIKEGTFEELAEEGLIDKENLYFEKGILIKIKNPVYHEKDKKITCGIEKWRSGLGAIGSDKVTAEYEKEKWIINKDGVWIS